MPARPASRPAEPSTTLDPVSRALETLLARHATDVRRVARQHGLIGADSDEVLQDVRIRLWRALATSDRIARVPSAYVRRTALSAARDLLRRRKTRWARERSSVQREPVTAGALRGPAARAVEIGELVGRALGGMRAARRRVVRLHLAGYHRLEIARRLGWTEARTRHLLYRGLAELRARLEENQVDLK